MEVLIMFSKKKVNKSMKKILNKNELTVLIVAIMLVTAGYLDYIEKNNTEATNANSDEVSQINEGIDIASEEIAKTGDATLVNGDLSENAEDVMEVSNNSNEEISINDNNTEESEETEDTYFATSKLERANMYSQTLENYQKILENDNISAEQKAITSQEISRITQTQNSIMICENLLLAKGFDKCVIFVNDNSVSVIIGKKELSLDEIAQIQNIISRELSTDVENIHISTK
jgi:stage III sporulation protein AH